MFFNKIKKAQTNKYKLYENDDVAWDAKYGYADFGEYKIFNKDVAKATKERLKKYRPNAKYYSFDEVVAESLTAFSIMADAMSRKSSKNK